MSSALAIAAVSAALKAYLENRLAQFASEANLNDVKVTVMAPDRINLGAEEASQVNLFLYRISPNVRLQKEATRAPKTSTQTQSATQAVLMLDLDHLLTIYGSEPLSSETLLGCVVQAMHEATPDRLRASLQAVTQAVPKAGGDGARGGKSAKAQDAPASISLRPKLSDRAIARFELKLMPQFLSMEDMSKLWSSLQAKYRLSMCYQLSGVVMSEMDDMGD